MAFGLSDNDLRLIRSVIKSAAGIQKVVVFGSRATGNYKPGSDVDLAVKGNGVTLRTISELSARLNEELPLPYKFDVLDYASVDNPALKEHIDVFGKILFRKT